MNEDSKGFSWGIQIAFLVLVVAYQYVDAIKDKNALERGRIEAEERVSREKIREEARLAEEKNENEYRIKKRALDRELENDCVKTISSLRMRYNNVLGGGYDANKEVCMVTTRDHKTGENLESPASQLIDSR